jgi:hypothetical protein
MAMVTGASPKIGGLAIPMSLAIDSPTFMPMWLSLIFASSRGTLSASAGCG